MIPDPTATWLLTFRTYGTWLPGDGRGWIHHGDAVPGTPIRSPKPGLQSYSGAQMRASPRIFGNQERAIVDAAIRDTCEFKRWSLHAVAVQTNHVHAVLGIDVPPHEALTALKAWATRRLREAGLDDGPVWARHGSTRYLPGERDITAACVYVLDGQDAPRD